MKIQYTRSLNTKQKEGIIDLWNKEYPARLQHKDIAGLDEYLKGLENASHYFMIDPDGDIKGWAGAFDREGERWFAIIVASTESGKGYGSMLMDALKRDNTKLSGWVIDSDNYTKSNGQPYASPLKFYLKNGFEVSEAQRLETDLISAAKIVIKK